MKEIKASIYDLKGYFVPGAVLVWTLYELISLLGYKVVAEAQTFSFGAKAVLAIIVSYITGHCMHAAANYTIDKLKYSCYPPKFYFTDEFAKDFNNESTEALATGISKIFGITTTPNTERVKLIESSYWHCFQYVMKNDVIDVENFLGFTGFYRGTAMAFFISGLIYAAVLFHTFTLLVFSLSAVYIAIGLLFLTRVRRFNCYLAKSVFSNFIYLATKS